FRIDGKYCHDSKQQFPPGIESTARNWLQRPKGRRSRFFWRKSVGKPSADRRHPHYGPPRRLTAPQPAIFLPMSSLNCAPTATNRLQKLRLSLLSISFVLRIHTV